MQLKNPVTVFVIKNSTSNRYLVGSTKKSWSSNLNNARKFNRKSDAQNCLNKMDRSEVEVVPVTFTHGYQPV